MQIQRSFQFSWVLTCFQFWSIDIHIANIPTTTVAVAVALGNHVSGNKKGSQVRCCDPKDMQWIGRGENLEETMAFINNHEGFNWRFDFSIFLGDIGHYWSQADCKSPCLLVFNFHQSCLLPFIPWWYLLLRQSPIPFSGWTIGDQWWVIQKASHVAVLFRFV